MAEVHEEGAGAQVDQVVLKHHEVEDGWVFVVHVENLAAQGRLDLTVE